MKNHPEKNVKGSNKVVGLNEDNCVFDTTSTAHTRVCVCVCTDEINLAKEFHAKSNSFSSIPNSRAFFHLWDVIFQGSMLSQLFTSTWTVKLKTIFLFARRKCVCVRWRKKSHSLITSYTNQIKPCFNTYVISSIYSSSH